MKKISFLLAFFCLFLALDKTFAYEDSYFLWDKKCIESSTNIPLWGKVYYSSDNKQYSYLTVKNNKQILVLNKEELNYFSNYTIYWFVNYWKDLMFSTNYNWKEVLFIWKKQVWVFDSLNKATFVVSKNNNSYMISWTLKWKIVLFKDQRIINVDLIDNNFWYSPDWEKYFYYYKTQEWFNLVFNWRYYKNYKVFFSKKTSNYVFIKYYKTKQSVVFYWKEALLYDEINNFIFSDNWRQYAFIWIKNWKKYLVKNWVEIPWVSEINWYSFSPDSKSFIFYWKYNSKNFYALNNKIYFPDVKSINSLNWTIDNNFLLNVSDNKFDNFFMINWVKNYNFTNIEKFIFSKANDNIAFLWKDFKNQKVLNISWKKIYWISTLNDLKFSTNFQEFLYSYKDINNNSLISLNEKKSKSYFNISNLNSSDNLGIISFYWDSKFVMCKDLTYSYKLSYKQKLQLDKIVKNVNKLPQKEKSYYKIQSLKKMSTYQKDTLQYDILKMIYQNID